VTAMAGLGLVGAALGLEGSLAAATASCIRSSICCSTWSARSSGGRPAVRRRRGGCRGGTRRARGRRPSPWLRPTTRHRLRRRPHAQQRAVVGDEDVAAAHDAAAGEEDAERTAGRVGGVEAALLRVSQSSSTEAARFSSAAARPRPWGISLLTVSMGARAAGVRPASIPPAFRTGSSAARAAARSPARR
jgi:hypothetical protein